MNTELPEITESPSFETIETLPFVKSQPSSGNKKSQFKLLNSKQSEELFKVPFKPPTPVRQAMFV